MGQFIDEFFQGLQEWSQRTASSEEWIRQLLVVDLDRYDENEDIEYNLDMVEKRVEVLVDEFHLSERFLMTALIREKGAADTRRETGENLAGS